MQRFHPGRRAYLTKATRRASILFLGALGALAGAPGCRKRAVEPASPAVAPAQLRPDSRLAATTSIHDAGPSTPPDASSKPREPSAFEIEEARATAEWRRRAPTGADYSYLLRELVAEEPGLVRPLARAFLRSGDFTCVTEEEQEECGAMMPVTVMGSLDPDARLGDPCLDRALALWALAKGRLRADDAEDLLDVLATMVKMPEPERELQARVMELMRGMDDPVRLALLAELPEDVAAANLQGLSGESLRELFSDTGLEAALLALPPNDHEEFLLAAMQSNEPSLSDATLGRLLPHFVDRKGANVEATLRWLAEEGPCEASMTAAVALAERGNSRFLPKPRRPRKDETEAEATWALCRISHDPDADRQLARYKEYLPARGEVVIEHTGEWTGSDTEAKTAFTRKQVTEWNLPSEVFAEPCSGDDCATSPTMTIHFARGKNGVLYLSGVEIYHPYTTC